MQFIQVHYASGFPLTPWHVHRVSWPFVEELYQSLRDFEDALMVAKQVSSVVGLPIATPAHIAVAGLQQAAVEPPHNFDYKFWIAQGAPVYFSEAAAEVEQRMAQGLPYRYATPWVGDDYAGS